MKNTIIESKIAAQENINNYNYEELANEIIDNNHLRFFLVIDDNGDVYHYWDANYATKRRGDKELYQVACPSYQYTNVSEDEIEEVISDLKMQLEDMAWELLDEIEDSYWEC